MLPEKLCLPKIKLFFMFTIKTVFLYVYHETVFAKKNCVFFMFTMKTVTIKDIQNPPIPPPPPLEVANMRNELKKMMAA